MSSQSKAEPAYRWVIVAASAVMLAVSMGMMVNGASVFLIPLNAEFGWDRGSVSLINVAGLLGLAVGGIVMGKIADRSSTRRVALFGAIVLGLSILAASQADQLWQFYGLFFIAGMLGAGALFAPLVANVGNWFVASAGLAVGIVSAGQALGQGGVPYGIAILIESMGWREALMVMGGFTLVVLVPLALTIRRAPIAEQVAGGAADEAPTPLPPHIVTIWISAAVLFCCTCMAVPLMHLVPLIQDRGLPLEEAGSVMFVMMIVAILGRIVFGKLSDILGAVRAYWIASCWQTVLVFGFMQIESLGAFYIFAIIYGFGYAGVMTGVIVTVRELTPVAKRASALGITTVFAWIGHGLGGYQGGFFFDLTGNYTLSYANAAMAGVINLIIVGALYFTIRRKSGPTLSAAPA
ncbi:MFS transporter [Sneathiella chungangensis]|uniref:MFS transporter n=1 Tax=Sneathiella chungangensis TaxID=1418234 RepID=A0A845MF60_9PROT|nr:MFS transporter [Sneathiella chungangensis]MZR22282.1 MFS transporter [Sneathiella chungangensis]